MINLQYGERTIFLEAILPSIDKVLYRQHRVQVYNVGTSAKLILNNLHKKAKSRVFDMLSNFHSGKSFKELMEGRYSNLSWELRKSLIDDPSQRWVGSFNGRQMILNKFFRWLYNSDEPDERKRMTPPCMQGVKKCNQGKGKHDINTLTCGMQESWVLNMPYF